MKKIMMASLIAAQTLVVAEPALSATLDDQPQTMRQSHGAFAGARLAIPLGGEKPAPRIGLALTSIHQTDAVDGSRRLRFSEGVEFGLVASGKPRLSLAGQPVVRFGVAQEEEDEDGGISTLGIVGIVVGGLLVVGGIGVAVLAHEISKNTE